MSGLERFAWVGFGFLLCLVLSVLLPYLVYTYRILLTFRPHQRPNTSAEMQECCQPETERERILREENERLATAWIKGGSGGHGI